jgi:hypothetical protein
MPLGAWIFATAVLLLVVLNKPFRKFFLWAAAVAGVCLGLFLGYMLVQKYAEERRQKHEEALQKQKYDACVTRLTSSPADFATKFGGKLVAFADGTTPETICTDNPEITYDVASAMHPKPQEPPTLDFSKAVPIPSGAKTKPAVLRLLGTVTDDTAIYSESEPAGPGGQILGKIANGTSVQVIRLDSIYDNVLVRTPTGTTGWVRHSEVTY